jgi:hypothetical protein
MRDFTLMNATGTAAASLPPGHVEGFADSFFAFFRAVYSDVAAGGRQDGSTWATFEDGHLRDGVLRCGPAVGAGRPLGETGRDLREERHASGPADSPIRGHSPDGGRRLGGRERLFRLRGGLLARERGEKRRYAGTSHIDVDGLTKDQGQEIIGGWRSAASRFPGSATTPTRSMPTRPTATR